MKSTSRSPARKRLAGLIKTKFVLVTLALSGVGTVDAKTLDIPTGLISGDAVQSPLTVSPANGGTGNPIVPFTQQMLRFEEFGTQPLPTSFPAGSSLPLPPTCSGTPDTTALDSFLTEALHPAPLRVANIVDPNPWASLISTCIGRTVTGVAEGRAPGENFSHQRWDEFPPEVYFQTVQAGARINGAIRNSHQLHGYAVGTEFGPGGLYNDTTGGGTNGTTSGIEIRLDPNLPIQNTQALWTFDGTLPPKLLMARYGVPILFRHYNVLPIDAGANRGFGLHTITTHEHNGHNPAESDGYTTSFFFPGEYFDYRWPMQLAGYDTINTGATDPRAATPCSTGETLMISNPVTNLPASKTCTGGKIQIPGDWHETMSTHWFHDHMLDFTAQNVYKGNAAMMNYYSAIDRGNEAINDGVNLRLPSGSALPWGNRDYDVNLLIADKAWDAQGQLFFNTLNLDGFVGDRMTVNWLYKPYFKVRARRYRFRMLNGSVSRFIKTAIVREFNDETTGDFPGPAGSGHSYSRVPFYMIANDGNIMEHAVPFPNPDSSDMPVQGIAERYDIVVDFSAFPAGTKLYLVNILEHQDGGGPRLVAPLGNVLSGVYVPDPTAGGDPAIGKYLEFQVQSYSGTDLSMNPADYVVGKKQMIPLVKFTDAEIAAAKHRTFEFGHANQLDGVPWTIKTDGGTGFGMDPHRVSAAPEANQLEIWHLNNLGGSTQWAHPVHIHFEEGQVLLRGGGAGLMHLPPLWEQGARKDVYRISNLKDPTDPAGLADLPDSGRDVDVLIRFREFVGTYMEHCHNTQHEDHAMLLRWDSEHPGQTIRMQTPMPSWDGVLYEASFDIETGTVKTGDTVTAAAYVAPLQLDADLDWNGSVNVFDYGIFRTQYGFGPPDLWPADLDSNGNVNVFDYGIFRTQYGKSVGYPVTPPLVVSPAP